MNEEGVIEPKLTSRTHPPGISSEWRPVRADDSLATLWELLRGRASCFRGPLPFPWLFESDRLVLCYMIRIKIAYCIPWFLHSATPPPECTRASEPGTACRRRGHRSRSMRPDSFEKETKRAITDFVREKSNISTHTLLNLNISLHVNGLNVVIVAKMWFSSRERFFSSTLFARYGSNRLWASHKCQCDASAFRASEAAEALSLRCRFAAAHISVAVALPPSRIRLARPKNAWKMATSDTFY